jgi:hypothetical protein
MKSSTKIKTTGLAIGLCCAVAVAPANATTFPVTRTDDPTPNGCTFADCSLREAVIATNLVTGQNKIKVEPGATYTLEIPGDSGPNVGDLNVAGTSDLRISGTRKKPVTIDANGDTTFDRAFKVDGDLRLDYVVISGGSAPLSNDNVARGGGIYVGPQGSLGMNDSMVTGNSASRESPLTGQGGGIYNLGTTTFHDSVVNGNTANGAGFGGGFYSGDGGFASFSDTVFRSNQATFGGGLSGDGGHTFLNESRIGRNHAGANGGGLFAINGAEFNLYSVNVDNNDAASSVGGIRARDATVRLRNVTVTANVSSSGGGISVQDDAGGDDGAIRLANSLIAGNTGGTTPDCRDDTGGQVTTSGYNLIGDLGTGAGACTMLAQPGDQFGGGGGPVIDAKLGTEGPYGGPLLPANNVLMSNPIAANSPAVNAGNPSDPVDPEAGECSGWDVRGVPRELVGRCDIGAYERISCEGVLVNKVGDQVDNNSKFTNLVATSGDDGYLVMDGKDKLRGGDGDDGLCGGEGKDTLNGEAGNDRIDGGPGHDVCIGGPGKDKAKGCEVERSIP